MKAILLIDHGSMRAEANNMLECMANLVQSMVGDGVVVRAAHMELAAPYIPDGLAQCVEAGATEIVVFPYMLSPGKHSTRDIPRMVAEAAQAHPHVACTVTSAFGVHDKLAEVIVERAGLGATAAAPRDPATAAAGGSCCMRPSGTAERYCGDGCRELATREGSRLSAFGSRR
jgi:sirohydrochlorin ferrochelatase